VGRGARVGSTDEGVVGDDGVGDDVAPRHGVPTRLVLASKSPARRATLVAAGITPEVIVSHVDEPAVLAALPGGRAFSGGATTPADEVLALATAKCRAVAEGLQDGRLGLPMQADSDSTRPLGALPGVLAAPVTSPTGAPTGPRVERLVVVGCDSMLELDGRMLGKPHRPEVARERIREMHNRSAVLWTGHFAVVLEHAGTGEVGDAGTGPWSLTGEVGASASTIVHFGEMSDAEIDAYVNSGEPLKVAGSFTVDGLGGPFVTGIEGDYHSVVGLSLPLLRSMLSDVGVFWPDLWDHRRAGAAR
jgi:MAF protein